MNLRVCISPKEGRWGCSSKENSFNKFSDGEYSSIIWEGVEKVKMNIFSRGREGESEMARERKRGELVDKNCLGLTYQEKMMYQNQAKCFKFS